MTVREALPVAPLAVLCAALALLAPAPSAAGPQQKPKGGPDLGVRPSFGPDHGGDTRCAACHTAESWKAVTFAHERTGFPLEGRHKEAACKACHSSGTFAEAVPRACAACHRDVHLGRLGPRCQDCHEPVTWISPTFDAQSHRRTNFPLTGRHAVTPCESCHGNPRDRSFARPTPGCIGCHEADWARASGGAAAVNHAGAGFPQDCRSCHGAWRFSPAGLPQHQVCFDIKSGPHAGIPCMGCHTSIPVVDWSVPFTCATDTANCLACHGGVAPAHSGVAGFQLSNRKCYECHRFSVSAGGLHLGVPR